MNFTQKRVKSTSSYPNIEYHLTLNMAKEFSMVECNGKDNKRAVIKELIC
ncbi:antA/AntB antirepressor family protein [Bartonella fuyuanensis]|nr:antA/AntB antirepressor family protein [Bartonella fuyuanensis]